jgi:hypothetical protein
MAVVREHVRVRMQSNARFAFTSKGKRGTLWQVLSSHVRFAEYANNAILPNMHQHQSHLSCPVTPISTCLPVERSRSPRLMKATFRRGLAAAGSKAPSPLLPGTPSWPPPYAAPSYKPLRPALPLNFSSSGEERPSAVEGRGESGGVDAKMPTGRVGVTGREAA